MITDSMGTQMNPFVISPIVNGQYVVIVYLCEWLTTNEIHLFVDCYKKICQNGRKIIIQAKRNKETVGNRAVQEVLGAVQYYGGDEGWVITNSTFTPSAKALAQASKIKLLDGKALSQIKDHIKELNAI